MTNATTTNETASREIIHRRLLNAPRELVYKVWTDPAHITKWWGPDGFTTINSEMTVEPGGTWRFMMHGHGTDFPNKIVFEEVVKNERLVYTHGSDEENDEYSFHVTVTFEEQGDKTALTMRALFRTVAQREKVVKEFGALEGGNQTLTRFEELLYDIRRTDKDAFSIVREFNAPRELVFKALTEYESMIKWWGPDGFTMSGGEIDLRPGGIFHYCLTAPNGTEMWGKMVYREIIKPERLVFVVSFSDKDGNIVRAPMSDTWPLEILNIMTFTEHNGKTTLTIAGGPIRATIAELEAYKAGQESLRHGFAGSFNKLDKFLSEQQ